MDKGDFEFENRKRSNKNNTNINFNNNRNFNDSEIEFSKGGNDGNGFNRFNGYVKSQSFSRICSPDPENPGKMICKETNNSKGYNPYDSNDKKVK
jgi:hypothetical protein